MFKKLLSVSLIFLMVVSGLTCVSSDPSPGYPYYQPYRIYIGGHIGGHYGVRLEQGIIDNHTVDFIVNNTVKDLINSRWLDENGTIHGVHICTYMVPYTIYEMHICFQW